MKYWTILILCCSMLSSCEEPFEWDTDYNLSIMSFNLRYDEPADGDNQWNNRKEASIKLLKETKPSVFGIQEGLYNQVTYLKDNLTDYNFVGVGRDDGHSSGEYAAIFYNTQQFDIVSNGNFWLSETPDTPSKGWDANNIRIVTWAHLKDKNNNDKSIYVFNTHFDHLGKTAQKESTKLLLRKIKEITNNENDTVFITGDFNVLIRDKALAPLIKEFYSARRYANYTDSKNSFNAFGKWYLSRNIDYIFYKNATALAFRTITKDYGVPYVSDHYPLITHFNY
ncbi:endonuclease/exonuclease/phosphatase family protein [Tenacibaculum mesophilum]|uniref:endonuclease/exonuclease/phosphatase family protein n=1 Tax=Tenacibaculum mesophilum TaxID=104268 RepID=UPI002491180B|nr:endonuclease/exonuclease/phosphatase family protein [Tenacibaculum mesophilum]